jgi:hypothetical protein
MARKPQADDVKTNIMAPKLHCICIEEVECGSGNGKVHQLVVLSGGASKRTINDKDTLTLYAPQAVATATAPKKRTRATDPADDTEPAKAARAKPAPAITAPAPAIAIAAPAAQPANARPAKAARARPAPVVAPAPAPVVAPAAVPRVVIPRPGNTYPRTCACGHTCRYKQMWYAHCRACARHRNG